MYPVASGTTICGTVWPFKAQPDISRVEEDLSTVQRQLKALKLDMDDLWDRFSRLSGKLAKRAAREDTPATDSSPGEEPDVLANGSSSPTFSRLTPRQKAIQIQIMHRRLGNGGST